VSIVDLGLVYEVERDAAIGHVQVTMALTALGCLIADDIITDIERRV
jgi:metal-sulfur cluster biosynthetic enzyme